MAKATTTIRQVLNYQAEHGAWFAENADLFNRVCACYFEVIQAHVGVLALPNTEALTALEKLTHTTKKNPRPVMPLSSIGGDIPAMFRRATINAAKEKPHTCERAEQSAGVVISQDVKSVGTQPSTGSARHGDHQCCSGYGASDGEAHSRYDLSTPFPMGL